MHKCFTTRNFSKNTVPPYFNFWYVIGQISVYVWSDDENIIKNMQFYCMNISIVFHRSCCCWKSFNVRVVIDPSLVVSRRA